MTNDKDEEIRQLREMNSELNRREYDTYRTREGAK